MISGENVRGIALDILMESESKASHLVLGRTLSKYQYMDKKERSFISRLTKGTIERRLTLDAMIGSYSSVKIGKMKPLIRNLLRMTAYQIYYMPAVPDAAACNEAVTLAKKEGFGICPALSMGYPGVWPGIRRISKPGWRMRGKT